MEPRVRDRLHDLIRRFGHRLAEEPARCEAMLKDLCGAHKREINVLIGALRQRVAVDLLTAGPVPAALLLGRLTRRLEDELAMAAEPARWAVETWALVLGVIDRPVTVAATPPPQPPQPPPPPPPPSGVPDIHGWSADRVRALQRDAARSLGLAVVFRDPLQTPIQVSAGGLSGLPGKGGTIGHGPEMAVIPAGSYLMGSPEGEKGRKKDEGPPHRVTIARPFALGRYAVTFDDYDAFCAATGLRKPSDLEGWGRDRQPAINVAWDDAVAYCQWLTGQTGQGYRLPSEAEWEYACRAGSATPFHFRATISTAQANDDGRSTYDSGTKGQYRARTVAAGSLPANPWGLHEMHGNVWEWCEDCCNDSDAGASTDGNAWGHGNCRARAVRGGSWNRYPRYLRAANRNWYGSGVRNRYVGFRVARTLSHAAATGYRPSTAQLGEIDRL